MYILAGLLVWFTIGLIWLKRFSDTTLPMMSDRRSNPRPWLAYPALILVVLLWPVGNEVSWWCFNLVRSLPLHKKKEVATIDAVARSQTPLWPNDLDINTLYADKIQGADIKKHLYSEYPHTTDPEKDEEYTKSVCNEADAKTSSTDFDPDLLNYIDKSIINGLGVPASTMNSHM
jgi:hypothetical protein